MKTTFKLMVLAFLIGYLAPTAKSRADCPQP